MLGHIQHVGRNQAPVGDHDGDVRLELTHPGAHLVGRLTLEGGGGSHGEPGLAGHCGHR